ncbi:HTH-type transcriptional repressor CsiR [Oceanisphaera marina]|uniref:HTH-type transcriptional repressor CsiR n=1 Tax=Oceanisphaera marina TaxID=2017550 RepID=A0ABQ1IDM3_9GAMM|nr:DNA-binding transcriptional regulator CsiR [Oceanisphaera marina]GGB35071.1 HTH-type transcriptional repressor CsiR [Oceanisphaera marina]
MNQLDIPRENLARTAYQQLKQDIIQSHFGPTEKLLMSTLKARYGLGVSPLREALSQLVSERLVTAESQRGFRVSSMSIAELKDIYDARAQLEGLIVELALARGDDLWEASVVAAHHALSKVNHLETVEDQLTHWDLRHQAFHQAVADGCQSPQLLVVRQTLMDQAARYRYLWLKQTVFSPQALKEKQQEHLILFNALLARDSQASTMMREHLMGPVTIISKVLGEQGVR